jgi:hypothetical protein
MGEVALVLLGVVVERGLDQALLLSFRGGGGLNGNGFPL